MPIWAKGSGSIGKCGLYQRFDKLKGRAFLGLFLETALDYI
jgi:hypothetical protein